MVVVVCVCGPLDVAFTTNGQTLFDAIAAAVWPFFGGEVWFFLGSLSFSLTDEDGECR